MISIPYILLGENFFKIPIFSLFFSDFQLRFYSLRLFSYATTSSTVTYDVTKLVMYRIINTNLQYAGTSFTRILNKESRIFNKF